MIQPHNHGKWYYKHLIIFINPGTGVFYSNHKASFFVSWLIYNMIYNSSHLNRWILPRYNYNSSACYIMPGWGSKPGSCWRHEYWANSKMPRPLLLDEGTGCY